MIPKNPQEMTAVMVNIMTHKLYLAITTAARRGRLTEHDIATIERSILREFEVGGEFAHEFETFEVEPAIANARQMVQDFAAMTKVARIKNISES